MCPRGQQVCSPVRHLGFASNALLADAGDKLAEKLAEPAPKKYEHNGTYVRSAAALHFRGVCALTTVLCVGGCMCIRVADRDPLHWLPCLPTPTTHPPACCASLVKTCWTAPPLG